MAGEIIRKGDRTSHGGVVIEGSPADICMGSPIAFRGHQTSCPACKGVYPIVEGVTTMTFYGKGVAVAGMRTACGAVLIAGQFTDTVEWGGGTQVSESKTATHRRRDGNNVEASLKYASDDTIEIERFYSLTDARGQPVQGYRYDLYTSNELSIKAGHYHTEGTEVVRGDTATRLVTWLEQDSASKGGAA